MNSFAKALFFILTYPPLGSQRSYFLRKKLKISKDFKKKKSFKA